MSLSRQNYQAVADIIRTYMDAASEQQDDRVAGTLEAVVDDLCIYFKQDNRAFNRERFEIACGV